MILVTNKFKPEKSCSCIQCRGDNKWNKKQSHKRFRHKNKVTIRDIDFDIKLHGDGYWD